MTIFAAFLVGFILGVAVILSAMKTLAKLVAHEMRGALKEQHDPSDWWKYGQGYPENE